MKSIRITPRIASFLVVVALASCAQPMTKKLFYQAHRPQALLPTEKEEKANSVGQLSEIVSYQKTIDTIARAKTDTAAAKNDGLKTFTLQGVTVTAERPRVKISTLRQGKVNLTFLVNIPKAFMDDRYQVVVTPTVTSGDTIFQLAPVVLKGKEFKKVQDQELKNFAAFEKSLVDSSRYDSVFFDMKKYKVAVKHIQDDYFYEYKSQLKRLLNYEAWRRKMEERYFQYNAKVKGSYDEHYHKKALEMLRNSYQVNLAGKDSTGIRGRFNSTYTPQREQKYLARKDRNIDLNNIPVGFRNIYKRGLTVDSLENKSLSERDSLEISQHTYDFRAIARNEDRIKNHDAYERHIVNFPKIDSAHLDETITPNKTFAYLYSQDIDVTPQIQKKIQLFIETRVVATDKSTWAQRGIDTLSYVISGINDLVDPTLIERWSDSEEAAKEYQEGLDRMAARDYRAALEIFRKYPDYNAAVAFAAMGDDERALIVLSQLNPTGKVEYLKALCYARQKNVEEAREALRRAVKQENFLVFKAETESNFADILADEAFHKELLDNGEELDE